MWDISSGGGGGGGGVGHDVIKRMILRNAIVNSNDNYMMKN